MSTLAERLAELVSEKPDYKQKDLAAACGVKPPSVANWFDGQTKNMEGANLQRAADYFGVMPLWLAEGKLPKFKPPTQRIAPSSISFSDDPDYIPIPLVNFKITGGVSGFAVDYLDGEGKPIAFRHDWYRHRSLNPANCYAMKVRGTSMEPGLYEEDVIVVNTAATEPVDGEVFAVNYEGEPIVKRLLRDAGTWWLTSDNDDKRRHPRKEFSEGIFIIGRVVHKQSERI